MRYLAPTPPAILNEDENKLFAVGATVAVEIKAAAPKRLLNPNGRNLYSACDVKMKLEAVKQYKAQKEFHEPNQQCNWAVV